jgi:hypothetical protein
MAEFTEIARLETYRRMLLDRSEDHRREMATELEALRPTAAWVERGYTVFQAVRSIWPVAATAAGFLVARKGGSIFRNAGRIWSAWRLARKFLRIWRSQTSHPPPA